MDIKNWDYIDPKIAKRLLDLQRTRSTLQQQHTNLSSNNRLHNQLKDKLIEQTKRVESKLNSMLSRQKHELIDYYDQQIIVVTKSKDQEKMPRLPIREEQSTVEHSNIAEQLKTSASTRRTKVISGVGHEASVRQFSIREKIDEPSKLQQSDKGSKATVLHSRLLRVRRKTRRQSTLLRLLKHKPKKESSILSSQDNEDEVEPCSASEIQVAGYLQEIEQYRKREQETDEYITLLKKKMKATSEHYQQRQAELQEQLAECAQRLARLADDHSRLDELQSQNETLRLERDELLKLLKQFV